jgi:hypothetical protein
MHDTSASAARGIEASLVFIDIPLTAGIDNLEFIAEYWERLGSFKIGPIDLTAEAAGNTEKLQILLSEGRRKLLNCFRKK